jgi:hypothetical protein
MFDFLHIPDLTDNYYRSLMFVVAAVTAFFGADYWLMVKEPDTFRKDIKLVDFFITRLRIFIPITFVLILATVSVESDLRPKSSLANNVLKGIAYTAVSFYGSILIYKIMTPSAKFSLAQWLSMMMSASIIVPCMDKYPISSSIGFVVYNTLVFLILGKMKV